jgi:hypothetical protein
MPGANLQHRHVGLGFAELRVFEYVHEETIHSHQWEEDRKPAIQTRVSRGYDMSRPHGENEGATRTSWNNPPLRVSLWW